MITLEEQSSVISVSHNMVLTMIDGKIFNIITLMSHAQVCSACGAAPKQVNQIVKLLKDMST